MLAAVAHHDTANDEKLIPRKMRKVIRPAVVRAGITEQIGWHPFRRTLATLLQENDVPLSKHQQDILRHVRGRLTLDSYAPSVPEQTCERKVGILRAVTASVPKRSLISLYVVVGA